MESAQCSIPSAPPPEIEALNRALALLQLLILQKRYASHADQAKDQDVYDRALPMVPLLETRLYKAPLSMMHDVLDRLCVAEYAGGFTDEQLDAFCSILARASVERMPWLYGKSGSPAEREARVEECGSLLFGWWQFDRSVPEAFFPEGTRDAIHARPLAPVVPASAAAASPAPARVVVAPEGVSRRDAAVIDRGELPSRAGVAVNVCAEPVAPCGSAVGAKDDLGAADGADARPIAEPSRFSEGNALEVLAPVALAELPVLGHAASLEAEEPAGLESNPAGPSKNAPFRAAPAGADNTGSRTGEPDELEGTGFRIRCLQPLGQLSSPVAAPASVEGADQASETNPGLTAPHTGRAGAGQGEALRCSKCGEQTTEGLTPGRVSGGVHIRINARRHGVTCGFWRRVPILLLAFALLFGSAARAEEWTPPDRLDVALLALDEALIVVDVLQTVGACSDPYNVFCESGPMIIVTGMRPSPGKVVLWGAVGAAATAALWYVLPGPWRKTFAITVGGVEGLTVAGNFAAGASIRF